MVTSSRSSSAGWAPPRHRPPTAHRRLTTKNLIDHHHRSEPTALSAPASPRSCLCQFEQGTVWCGRCALVFAFVGFCLFVCLFVLKPHTTPPVEGGSIPVYLVGWLVVSQAEAGCEVGAFVAMHSVCGEWRMWLGARQLPATEHVAPIVNCQTLQLQCATTEVAKLNAHTSGSCVASRFPKTCL